MTRLPPHPPGLRIGLYGGSFNPPHAGHLHVGLLALKRLRLDRKGRFKIKVAVALQTRLSATGSIRLKGVRSRLGLERLRTRTLRPGKNTITFVLAGSEARRVARRGRGGSAQIKFAAREKIGPRDKSVRWTRTLKISR